MANAPLARRILPDGRILEAWQYLYNCRLTVTEPHYDGICYEDGWCYPDQASAIMALVMWNGEGEPFGWIKHPASGRSHPAGFTGNTPESPVMEPAAGTGLPLQDQG